MVSKCKNSVFCIHFLFFFLFGTISGVLCFRCMLLSNQLWTGVYCDYIGQSVSSKVLQELFVLIRPFFLVLLCALHPNGWKLLFPLIFIRGFLMSYCYAALWFGGYNFLLIVAKAMFLLPLYFFCCKWLYASRNCGLNI